MLSPIYCCFCCFSRFVTTCYWPDCQTPSLNKPLEDLFNRSYCNQFFKSKFWNPIVSWEHSSKRMTNSEKVIFSRKSFELLSSGRKELAAKSDAWRIVLTQESECSRDNWTVSCENPRKIQKKIPGIEACSKKSRILFIMKKLIGQCVSTQLTSFDATSNAKNKEETSGFIRTSLNFKEVTLMLFIFNLQSLFWASKTSACAVLKKSSGTRFNRVDCVRFCGRKFRVRLIFWRNVQRFFSLCGI